MYCTWDYLKGMKSRKDWCLLLFDVFLMLIDVHLNHMKGGDMERMICRMIELKIDIGIFWNLWPFAWHPKGFCIQL